MNAAFPHLFQPLLLKEGQLKNRVIMGSMHTGLEESQDGFTKLAEFYKQRAIGGVGLIITGGISPNFRGRLAPFSAQLSYPWQVKKYQQLTAAVKPYNCKMCLQLLHAGRYAYHPFSLAPSAIKSPITPFKPSGMSLRQIKTTIKQFVKSAQLASKAGFDGVEIMGSEGYLINQFLSEHTNKRQDHYGGDLANRMRLAIEIVKAINATLPDDFIVIYRISLLDFITQGMPWHEVEQLAAALIKAGVSILNSGIGWHEARVPTIATSVPAAAFAFATEKLKQVATVPVVATNRINTPEIAERILADKQADLVCLARPFLADSHWVSKAEQNQSQLINTCIGCNQACLDHVFKGQRASCLVNPQACYETERVLTLAQKPQKIAVVGSGPAGLAFSCYAAECGHEVSLFEKDNILGGQFNIAKRIPGKADFQHTLRYFENRLKQLKVKVKLNTAFETDLADDYQQLVIATGIQPRVLNIAGIEHNKVRSYLSLFQQSSQCLPLLGSKVAIIGAGGIGFDVAEFLIADEEMHVTDATNINYKQAWFKQWGVSTNVVEHRAGLMPKALVKSAKKLTLLQRKNERLGKNLAKTTGWIHRQSLKDHQVEFIGGVEYLKIDDQGLHILQEGQPKLIPCDNVIICAGQEPNNALYHRLTEQGRSCYLIGGALKAAELDAKTAIKQALDLAIKLSE